MKYAKDIEHKIMNVFVIFSVRIFLYFRFHIFDQGACSNIVAPSINRDPSKTPTSVHFKDNFFHSLRVLPVTQISVQTSNFFTCEVLNTDKYSVSEKFHPNETFHQYSIVVSRNDFFFLKKKLFSHLFLYEKIEGKYP